MVDSDFTIQKCGQKKSTGFLRAEQNTSLVLSFAWQGIHSGLFDSSAPSVYPFMWIQALAFFLGLLYANGSNTDTGSTHLVTRLETEGPFFTPILPAAIHIQLPSSQVHLGIFLLPFLWTLYSSNSDIHIHIFLFVEKALNMFHSPPLTQEIIFIFFSI